MPIDGYGEETLREPLGSTTAEQKKASTKKVFFREVDGRWLPEFIGLNINARDINFILRGLRQGYRRYRRLNNLNARLLLQEQEVKNAAS